MPKSGGKGGEAITQAVSAGGLRLDAVSQVTSRCADLLEWLEALLAEYDLTASYDCYGGDIDVAYHRLKASIGRSPDIILRRFQIGGQTPALIAFVDGQVDNALIDRDTLMVLQWGGRLSSEIQTEAIKEKLVTVGHVSSGRQWSYLIPQMMLGNTLLFLDQATEVLVLDTVKYPARTVSRAQSEPSIKGPQEAFAEVPLIQMDQMRRRLPAEDLRFDPVTIGWETHTTVLLTYLQGVANPALVEAVRTSLHAIQRASVQVSNEVAEYLVGRRWTIFPQVRLSSRVDLIARNVAQGKVAILVAGDPTALLLPNTLLDFYQTTQDYALPFWDGSLMRVIRFLSLGIGLYLMPLYIALTSVNPDLLPVRLLLTISGSRLGIPFPPVAEVVIMWVIIEVLREAANRLPQQLATTIGTVGAVVVGTAVVKAGIVDAIMIVTVTLTALGLFATPAIELASTWRWLFWFLIVASWIFGVYGIVLATVAIVVHLASLENFGTPYLSPFGPLRLRDMKDSIVRFPFPSLTARPVSHRTLVPEQGVNTPPAGREVDLYDAQVHYRSTDPGADA